MNTPQHLQIRKDLVNLYHAYIDQYDQRPTQLLVSPSIHKVIPASLFQECLPEIRVKQFPVAGPALFSMDNDHYIWFEQRGVGPRNLQGKIAYLNLESLLNPPKEPETHYPTLSQEIAKLLVEER